jgi:hypothetical protein
MNNLDQLILHTFLLIPDTWLFESDYELTKNYSGAFFIANNIEPLVRTK